MRPVLASSQFQAAQQRSMISFAVRKKRRNRWAAGAPAQSRAGVLQSGAPSRARSAAPSRPAARRSPDPSRRAHWRSRAAGPDPAVALPSSAPAQFFELMSSRIARAANAVPPPPTTTSATRHPARMQFLRRVSIKSGGYKAPQSNGDKAPSAGRTHEVDADYEYCS